MRRLKRVIAEWKIFIIVAFLLAPGLFAAVSAATHEKAHKFAPVSIRQLRVEPGILEVGQPATLYNGYCNNGKQPVSVQIYFGAQGVSNDSLLQPKLVDLLKDSDGNPVKDTPEGRIRQTLPPGCVQTNPIAIPAVPDIIDSGIWRLYIHLVVTSADNKTQNVPFLSDEFIMAGH